MASCQAQAQNFQQATNGTTEFFKIKCKEWLKHRKVLDTCTTTSIATGGYCICYVSWFSTAAMSTTNMTHSIVKTQQLYELFQRLGFVSDIYQGMPSSGMPQAWALHQRLFH